MNMDDNLKEVILNELKEFLDKAVEDSLQMIDLFKNTYWLDKYQKDTYEDVFRIFGIKFDYFFYFKYRGRIHYLSTFSEKIEHFSCYSEDLLLDATAFLYGLLEKYFTNQRSAIRSIAEDGYLSYLVVKEYAENELPRIKKKTEMAYDLSGDELDLGEFIVKKYVIDLLLTLLDQCVID